MRFLFIILFAMSAFAAEDEAVKLVETSKARRETWKTFREKVSEGDLCQPKDYTCFMEAVAKIPGFHPEDLIAARSIFDTFYLRSLKDTTIPCSDTCQQNMRAYNVHVFLNFFLNYNTGKSSIYNFKDSSTVRATRIRAYMDLSAYANIKEDMKHVKAEFAKIDFSNMTIKSLKQSDFEKNISLIDSGALFSNSVLCHLHPGSLIYDEIMKGKSKVDAKYSAWLKDFDENGRKICSDQTPIEYRGMDLSTREYYDQQTVTKLKAIKCKDRDFACLRKEFRKLSIHYEKDIRRVMKYISDFSKKGMPPADKCDATCEGQYLLRETQTFITFLSQYDRQKLASTMDWEKYPEEKYQTLSEDVAMFEVISKHFNSVLTKLGSLDPKLIKHGGLKSELKSTAKDVSYFASGEMFKDSVICTMEPWTAAYDKYMTPYKQPKRNKKFEQGFLQFKEQVCK